MPDDAGREQLAAMASAAEAIMLGDDLGELAGALIRRLPPAQLTELGLQLLVAGSSPQDKPQREQHGEGGESG